MIALGLRQEAPESTSTTRGRTGTDYTSQLLAAPLASASEAKVAAVETAAGLWARGMMAAEVAGPGARYLPAAVRGQMARDLLVRGETLWAPIAQRDGVVRLVRATVWDVYGAAVWRYWCTFSMPTDNLSAELTADRVIHVLYSMNREAPWLGVGPLAAAFDSVRAAAAITGAMADEFGGPRGSLLPVPPQPEPPDGEEGTDKDPLVRIKQRVMGLAGAILAVETSADAHGAGPGAAPREDYGQKRIGAAPPNSVAGLWERAELGVLEACGIPGALVAGKAGTANREAWRHFLGGTLAPVARLIAEAARPLIGEVRFRWRELQSGDVAGRARAYQSLVGAGMPDSDARELCGL